MPMYFFHSEDGQLTHDDDGTELADVEAARVEAVRFAGALMSDRPQALWAATRWRLLVTDYKKMILFTIEMNTVLGADVIPWKLAS